jgi:hypothetical protein
MKRGYWTVLVFVVLVAGVSFAAGFLARLSRESPSARNEGGRAKTLVIEWQRLVVAGRTCGRCGDTQGELREAHAVLRKSLSPLGINVVLKEKKLDKATATLNITESNRIWIAGKPLEEWLGATPGASDCTSCGSLCGPLVGGKVQCRTVIVGQNAFESIPSEMIVKAGLLAAAEMVGAEADQPAAESSAPCVCE